MNWYTVFIIDDRKDVLLWAGECMARSADQAENYGSAIAKSFRQFSRIEVSMMRLQDMVL